ncbi:unnamed protein product [Rhodiola kirilowii]
MSAAHPVLLRSAFLRRPPPLSYLSFKPLPHIPRRRSYSSRIRAVELDQNTVIAIAVGVASVAVGIGIPVFYETQIDSAAKRDNTQPCFPCNGTGARNVTVDLGGDEKEVSRCINCDGAGSLTCTTCQGNGIQPRYLDRRCVCAFTTPLALASVTLNS